MKLLLDTHAYFWWITNDRHLSATAAAAIADEDAEILLSAVVAWELATKSRLGKWPEAQAVVRDLDVALEAERFSALVVTLDHARLAGSIASPHKDPFDRMLAAQSEIEGAPIVTADPALRSLGSQIVW